MDNSIKAYLFMAEFSPIDLMRFFVFLTLFVTTYFAVFHMICIIVVQLNFVTGLYLHDCAVSSLLLKTSSLLLKRNCYPVFGT